LSPKVVLPTVFLIWNKLTTLPPEKQR
jgi:hypothetical protein